MNNPIINWLKDAEEWEIKGGGIVYSGPAPFTFDKDSQDDMDALYKRPWVISHPNAKDKLWCVKRIESFAIQWIYEGVTIGILVEPWED